MKKNSRILIAALCLAMIPSFWFPLWNILLGAPQYPEGLHMEIWQDHLSGDLNTINGLNHYIGMQTIEEEDFPELNYIMWFVIGVIATGLLMAFIGNRWLYAGWYFIFLAIAAYGIYDFWQWEYIYGHNLDPAAPIKMEGMSYQPPLIGCKQLLNFTACSFPALGGILIMMMGTVSFCILAFEFYFRKKIETKHEKHNYDLRTAAAHIM